MTNRQKFFVILSVLFSGSGLVAIFAAVAIASPEAKLDLSGASIFLFAMAFMSAFADTWLSKIGVQ